MENSVGTCNIIGWIVPAAKAGVGLGRSPRLAHVVPAGCQLSDEALAVSLYRLGSGLFPAPMRCVGCSNVMCGLLRGGRFDLAFGLVNVIATTAWNEYIKRHNAEPGSFGYHMLFTLHFGDQRHGDRCILMATFSIPFHEIAACFYKIGRPNCAMNPWVLFMEDPVPKHTSAK
ncbi:hypothetical protein Pelo_1948 [Pelomyxa schiedti]|nr:hypothetical protein Pelo_1948 [Pelomyxa schiedti]